CRRLGGRGRADVRTPAKSAQLARPVNADLVTLDLVPDQLKFEFLTPLLELFHRPLARKNFVLERDIGLSEPSHPRFDGREIRLRNWLSEVEVVIETVLHSGPDAVPRFRVVLRDRRCQQDGSRVSELL